jgi:Rod binding domain-containing protein
VHPVDSIGNLAMVSGEARGVPRLEQPRPADETAQKLLTLRKASRDFESIFIARLLEPMVKSVGSMSQGQQFGGGVMLNVAAEKMAESIAGKGGVGLGDMLYESLKERVISESSTTSDTQPSQPDKETTEHPLKILKINPEVLDVLKSP